MEISSKKIGPYDGTKSKCSKLKIDFCFHFFSPDPIHYDPSSAYHISQNPLRSDPFEDIHVVVSTSKIGDEAGEGLFSRTFIKKDQLVCLFNGIRRIKKGRVTRISANDEDWSDYRIVLGKFLGCAASLAQIKFIIVTSHLVIKERKKKAINCCSIDIR